MTSGGGGGLHVGRAGQESPSLVPGAAVRLPSAGVVRSQLLAAVATGPPPARRTR
jgi:hypothetical protein